MTFAMTERDEAAGLTSHSYHYTRVVTLAGHTVRARITRDHYIDQSHAIAEVLNDHKTWTSLAADPTGGWWHSTPPPADHIHASATLRSLAESLLHRAADILAAPPTPRALSPHLYGAISALLATSGGFDAERRIDPDEITWAYNHGGRLHIIEHPDGAVTFTKAHRQNCPFITSQGAQPCDEDCYTPHPADSDRERNR